MTHIEMPRFENFHRVPPMREHIQNDSNMNTILIFLGIQIGTIIVSFIAIGLLIGYNEFFKLRLGWAPTKFQSSTEINRRPRKNKSQ